MEDSLSNVGLVMFILRWTKLCQVYILREYENMNNQYLDCDRWQVVMI